MLEIVCIGSIGVSYVPKFLTLAVYAGILERLVNNMDLWGTRMFWFRLTIALLNLYKKTPQVTFCVRYTHFILQFILSTPGVSDLLLLITPSIHEHSNHFTAISDLNAASSGLEPRWFFCGCQRHCAQPDTDAAWSGEHSRSSWLHDFRPGTFLHPGLCQMQTVRMSIPVLWELWTKCDNPSYMLWLWKKEWASP